MFSNYLIKLKNNGSNPTVTYQPGKMIRNKILNCKDAVSSIYVDEDVSFRLTTDQCDMIDKNRVRYKGV